jgi:hypothetical protein
VHVAVKYSNKLSSEFTCKVTPGYSFCKPDRLILASILLFCSKVVQLIKSVCIFIPKMFIGLILRLSAGSKHRSLLPSVINKKFLELGEKELIPVLTKIGCLV